MRLCLTNITLGSPLSAGQDADNQAYVDALKTAFDSVSISWFDTSYNINSIAYDAKVARANHSTQYPIHSYDSVNTVTSTTAEDTYLTFGAFWRPTGSTLPKKCQPAWFWNLTTLFGNGNRGMLVGLVWGTSLGSITFANVPLNADDIPYPFSDDPLIPWNSATNSGTRCQNPSGPSAATPLQNVYRAANTLPAISIATPPCFNFFDLSRLLIRSSSGAVTLPLCSAGGA
jgi:hypothetical protein